MLSWVLEVNVDLLFPAISKEGFQAIIEPPAGQLRLLNFGLLSLKIGETWEKQTGGCELALIMLGGKCELWANEQHWAEAGEREHVFGGRATALYLPAQSSLKVTALTSCETAVITAPATKTGKAILIRPQEVNVRAVGKGNWRRSVQDIIDARVPAQRLLIGETYNEPGEWSSYPPHKHDVEIPGVEACLEEVYHFRVNPPQGFGLQRIYSPETGLNETYTIKDGDTVAIPRGYHPVAAAPGYVVYYLWALAGERREMRPHDDPQHAWVS